MSYTGQQKFLLKDAEKYHSLGYKVGLCQGKKFLMPYEKDAVVSTIFGPMVLPASLKDYPSNFDGISLIPDGMVCVDIDVNDFSMIHEGLPPTLKERTPRGWHLFYRHFDDRKASPKIKWREHVDLLVKDNRSPSKKKPSRYGSSSLSIKVDGKEMLPKDNHWGEHVLISPTNGYTRIWPDEIPRFNDLPDAPMWLIDALEQ